MSTYEAHHLAGMPGQAPDFTLDRLLDKHPAIVNGEAFSPNPERPISASYVTIKTYKLLQSLAMNGYRSVRKCGQQPVRTKASDTADIREKKSRSAKHYVLMNFPIPELNEEYQILIVNSHRGNFALRILVGKFTSAFHEVKCHDLLYFAHYRHVQENVVLTASELVNNFLHTELPVAIEQYKAMRNIFLKPEEIQRFLVEIAGFKKRKGVPVISGPELIEKYYVMAGAMKKKTNSIANLMNFSMQEMVKNMRKEKKAENETELPAQSLSEMESDMTVARRIREYCLSILEAKQQKK
jgi:hypothetical protein